MAEDRRKVKYFISYARANTRQVEDLLKRLELRLRQDIEFDFETWRDNDLIIGERWHEGIQRALDQCDFGLLFLSYDFFDSRYIREDELPKLLEVQPEGRVKALPVGLGTIVLDGTVNLMGVDALQIFRDDKKKFYEQLRGDNPKNAFADQLREQLREVAKRFQDLRGTGDEAPEGPEVSVTLAGASDSDDPIRKGIREALNEDDLGPLEAAVRKAAQPKYIDPRASDLADLLCAPVMPLDIAVSSLTLAAQAHRKTLTREGGEALSKYLERAEDALGWLLLRSVDHDWLVRHQETLRRAERAKVRLNHQRPSCVEVALSGAMVRGARFERSNERGFRSGKQAIRMEGEAGFEPLAALQEVLEAVWQKVVRREIPRLFGPDQWKELKDALNTQALVRRHFHLTVELSRDAPLTEQDLDELQRELPELQMVLIQADGNTALQLDDTRLDWLIQNFFELVIEDKASP